MKINIFRPINNTIKVLMTHNRTLPIHKMRRIKKGAEKHMLKVKKRKCSKSLRYELFDQFFEFVFEMV